MDWPLLWDPFNVLELPAVPITVVIDAAGVIRLRQPKLSRAGEAVELIRKAAWNDDEAPGRVLPSPVPGPEAMRSPADKIEEAWSDHSVALALWGGPSHLDEALEASVAATTQDAAQGRTWFRRGVVSRLHYDSVYGRPSDLSVATEAWATALQLDPDNYIWRRRLQQYGPRLAKPYAFYDWIPQAWSDIEGRGEEVPELVTEPEGAEFADPSNTEKPIVTAEAPPLPDSRITVDAEEWISVTTNVVPAQVEAGGAARVRLEMVPADAGEVHWNNEAGPGGLWVQAPPDWKVEPRFQEIAVPGEATSDERRHVAFEVEVPSSAESGSHTMTAVALYAICESETGVCLLRRRVVPVPVVVEEGGLRLSD